MRKWTLELMPHGQVVRPVDDIVEHTSTEYCICFPSVLYLGRHCYCEDNGPKMSVVKQITHNAMAGRE